MEQNHLAILQHSFTPLGSLRTSFEYAALSAPLERCCNTHQPKCNSHEKCNICAYILPFWILNQVGCQDQRAAGHTLIWKVQPRTMQPQRSPCPPHHPPTSHPSGRNRKDSKDKILSTVCWLVKTSNVLCIACKASPD